MYAGGPGVKCLACIPEIPVLSLMRCTCLRHMQHNLTLVCKERYRRQPSLPQQTVAGAAGSGGTAACDGGTVVCSGGTAGCSQGTAQSLGLHEWQGPRDALQRRRSGRAQIAGRGDARKGMQWQVLTWPGCVAWACPAAVAAAVLVAAAAAGWLPGCRPGCLRRHAGDVSVKGPALPLRSTPDAELRDKAGQVRTLLSECNGGRDLSGKQKWP